MLKKILVSVVVMVLSVCLIQSFENKGFAQVQKSNVKQISKSVSKKSLKKKTIYKKQNSKKKYKFISLNTTKNSLKLNLNQESKKLIEVQPTNSNVKIIFHSKKINNKNILPTNIKIITDKNLDITNQDTTYVDELLIASENLSWTISKDILNDPYMSKNLNIKVYYEDGSFENTNLNL